MIASRLRYVSVAITIWSHLAPANGSSFDFVSSEAQQSFRPARPGLYIATNTPGLRVWAWEAS